MPSRLTQSTNPQVSSALPNTFTATAKYTILHRALIHQPVFRDQLYKHLETVPAGDFDAYTNKLVQAGGTLEYLKYADPLFEILIAGGLLQPGGSYIDDGAPPSPFSIFNAKEPVEAAEIKKYVEVLNKLIRRYVSFRRFLDTF